jgi:hypothetical protein
MLKLDFKQKYLKYKYKYLYFKSQIGGSDSYLWYVEDEDRKFSLLNIYEAEEEYEKLATTKGVGEFVTLYRKKPININIKMSVCIKKNISNAILELKQNQDEIKKKYPYCKKPLLSKLSMNNMPINERLSVGDIKLL